MKKNPRMKVLGDLEELFEGRLAGKLSDKPKQQLEGEGDVPIDPKDLEPGMEHKEKPSFESPDHPPGSPEDDGMEPVEDEPASEESGETELDIEKLSPEEQKLLEKLYNKMCGDEHDEGDEGAENFKFEEELG